MRWGRATGATVGGIDRVTVADGVVTKRHGGDDGTDRAARAAAAMRAARTAGLPVPTVLGVDGRELRVMHVAEAATGIAALGAAPARVLGRIGGIARALHAVTPPPLVAAGGGTGVWVHGDLCPINVAVSGGEIVAVLDWEDSRVDDPLVDLVWSEWLVRTYHPELVRHLAALYGGYAVPVPGEDRRRAVLTRVLRRHSERGSPGSADLWRRHLDALPHLDLTVARHR